MSERARPDTEIDIDMTPMIDVTFLMIIFFIIVNDLTQQELEDLKLPVAIQAGHDDPPPGRPILNVMGCTCTPGPRNEHQKVDGKKPFCAIGDIIWKKKKLFWEGIEPKGSDPIRKARPDFYWKLALQLEKFAQQMETDEDPNLGPLPDEPILIRADRNTEFKYISRIMEACSRQNVRIWKVQLAASEPESAKEKKR
ncbi:MAG: biopolymer transporter ExbD [Planctomycetota bacterium]|jgi:biopolymer transport protein ExbD|nr:biopolymer transporter ExbD [Planctomycetota bacterium]|tara:strand:- start:236 stop:826 length:591 start_codon:yes stop_codon:yes gene_type:complete